MDDHRQFNQVATEFLTEMIATFPDEIKIKTYKSNFDLVKKLNFKKPVEIFMDNLEPFGLQIMAKNEKFFQDDQYVNKAESISGKMGLIDHWTNLPDVTKDTIWNYMQTLYVLGMKTMGKGEELRKILSQL